MATMKTLIIQPEDVSANPIGDKTTSVTVNVSISYDRDVATGNTYTPGSVPFVTFDIPTPGGLSVPVLMNDDPSITVGAGFQTVVKVTYTPQLTMQSVTRTYTLNISSAITDDTVGLLDPRISLSGEPVASAGILIASGTGAPTNATTGAYYLDTTTGNLWQNQ